MAHTCPMPPETTNDHNRSQRRRELFPSHDEDSDDLGHISPLSDSTPPDSPIELPLKTEYTPEHNFSKSTISDYIILENIRNVGKKNAAENGTPLSNKVKYSEDSMSPLYLSPVQQATVHSPSVPSPKKLAGSDKTCSRKSPSVTLKTPQATSNINLDIPKLIRKTPFDGRFASLECGKRKIPLSVSPPISKHLKLDQGARVRTALFPKPEVLVPTTSFYSKSNNNTFGHTFKNINVKTKIIKQKTSTLYLCGRKANQKRSGQINAGVRHKIRKPKPKKVVQSQLWKAALNIIDYTPLTYYLDNLRTSQDTSKLQLQGMNTILNKSAVSATSILQNPNNEIDDNVMERALNFDKSQSRKRELSPPPDPNKKFFKFKRSNATITVDKHLKFKVDDGKLSLLNKKPNKRFKGAELNLNFDADDLNVPETNFISQHKIDDILFTLDNENNKENDVQEQVSDFAEQLVLKAHNSVTMSENAIHLHMSIETQPKKLSLNCGLSSKTLNEKSVLLSPTSQMCNMTSGLALNSPKKAKQNINNILNSNNLSNKNAFNEIYSALDMEQEKLFPIFYGTNQVPSKSAKAVKTVQQPTKKFKALSKDQMLLDAGQKRFGVSQCCECKFVYHMGDPNDELLHINYHNAGNVLRFQGWKDEHVMAQFVKNARIIRVLPSDPKPWNRKVKDLIEVVNRDLGFYEMPVSLNATQVFLYIKNKTIAGCLVAESKSHAYRLLCDNIGIDLCSEKSYPVKCGVSRIWVSQMYRKEGIGTALLNSLRANFMHGSVLARDDVALSSPTEAGKAFATKYFNTPNFLIYTS